MKLQKILKISRPRFWIYELGPYALGIIASAGDISLLPQFVILAFALFFLFPANLYIYGINDIFDYETDIKNPKKVSYEALVTPAEHRSLFSWIFFTCIPFVFLLPLNNIGAVISLIAFFFFAGFYSAKPIRAKAIPFLDSFFSAGHYVATGAFGYYLLGGSGVPIVPLIAGMLWAIAMHAYSAALDIDADKDAGLDTIATLLGKNKTIILCGVFYIISAILITPYLNKIVLLLGLLYLLLMLKTLTIKTQDDFFKLYKFFPPINTISGMIIFFILLFERFY